MKRKLRLRHLTMLTRNLFLKRNKRQLVPGTAAFWSLTSTAVFFALFSLIFVGKSIDTPEFTTSAEAEIQEESPAFMPPCVLTISQVSVGDCKFNENTNQSEVIVAVFLEWDGDLPPGEVIEVTVDGTTETLDPTVGGQPNYVQFILNSDGSSGMATAQFDGGGCVATSVNYTLPGGCAGVGVCGNNDEIGGIAFADFDANGVRGASEFGVEGVTVHVFDCDNNVICDVLSDENGRWLCTGLTPGADYRVEFSDFPNGYTEGGDGADSKGGSVQFVTAGDCGVDFGAGDPELFCNENPWVVIPCYINGDPTVSGGSANGDVLVAVPYFPGTNLMDQSQNQYLALNGQIGPVWGTAYSRSTKEVFTASFLKRHSGLTSEGLGAIWKTDISNLIDNNQAPADLNAANSLFYNLDAASINTGDEADFAGRDLTGNPSDPSHDPDVLPLIGKYGLGDLDISSDDDSLFVVNLYNKTMVVMAVGNPAGATEIPIPDPGCWNSNTDMASPDDWRPFGLKYNNGTVYVGGVCSAEASQVNGDMRAVVYSWTPADGMIEILNFPLDYARGNPAAWMTPDPTDCEQWNPWSSDFDAFKATESGRPTELCYSQPMLSDIEFDVFGNMVLSIMDRNGHQVGWQNYSPVMGDNETYNGNAGGDLLRVFNNNGTWLVESGGVVGFDSSLPDGLNGEGPGGGEFYNNDDFGGHEETAHGSLTIHPSNNEIVLPMLDPIRAFSAGIGWFNNANGAVNNRYEVYVQDNPGDTEATFGKAHGLGDIELGCKEPTIEIGNYVWFDEEVNGIQEACETALSGINVTLYDKAGVELDDDVTDADGYYLFKDLDPNTDYIIAFGTGGQVSGGALTLNGDVYVPTSKNTGTGMNASLNDSDIALGDNTLPAIVQGLPVICLTTGALGENDHSFDAGFISGLDYGDLPDTYATVIGSNGARHILKNGLYLGSCVDFEADGAPDFEAGTDGTGGDDQTAGIFSEGTCAGNDDEDGISLMTSLIPGTTACIEVTATSMNGTAVLNGWIDFDGNGSFSGGEALNFTSIDGAPTGGTTDAAVANGTGTYIYCFDVPSGATFPNQETHMRFRLSMNGGLSYDGPADSGEVEDYYQPLAKIGNLVWEDLNGNALQDGNEPGFPGVTVSISGTDLLGNPVDASLVTGIDGMYMFPGLLPNEQYCITFDKGTAANPQNLIYTPQDVPNNGNEPNDSDANVVSGDAGCYTPMPLENIDIVDAGIYSDKDGDFIPDMMDPDMGVADPQGYVYCEDTGEIIPGGLVQIVAGPGAVDLILDGSNGEYQFHVTQPGIYTISFTPPAGYIPSTSCLDQGLFDFDPMNHPNPFSLGADDADMNNFLDDATCGSNPFYFQFQLEVGEFVLHNNIPLSCGELGDVVWEDNDLDGVQDPMEPGVPDIVVNLFECAGGVKGNQIATTTTDGNGNYEFTGLPGNEEYCVQFDLGASTNPNAGTYSFTTQDQTAGGGNDTNDSDADPADGCTTSVNLVPGQEFDDFDAGVYLLDLGDLPEGTGYPTSLANMGAAHSITSAPPILKIGATVDAENDGQPDPNALGDGLDEDGVNLPMFATNTPVDVPVQVMNMTGGPAKLVMFADWNNDGDFDDTDEMYDVMVQDGDNLATFQNVTPPLTANLNNMIGIRFRISTDMNAVMSPTGTAPDGEVEDYLAPSMGFDYGDLNDTGLGTSGDPGQPLTPANYQTTNSDDGARHKIITDANDNPLLKIGAAVDDEADGQPSADAGITGGDDNAIAPFTTDPDDEDGLDLNNIPLFILTQTTMLDIPVMNMTSDPATIAVFVDFNKDGSFDPTTEKFTAPVPVNATMATVNINVPVTSVVGQDLGLRIRLANDMAEVMQATGLANSGEVEDYMIQVIGFDYGDLPDTYGTTDPNGPKHIVTEDLTLGNCVDSEVNGLPEPMAGLMAGGDDNDPGLATFGACMDGDDDEDGIEFVTPLIANTEACIEVTAVNNTGADAMLQLWIDYNGNGSFDGGEEVFFTSANGNTIPNGGVTDELYCFMVPSTATFDGGAAFVRARLAPMGPALAPDSQTLPVPLGEIEDYKVPLAKLGNLVWEDSDFDGTQDAGEAGLPGVTVNMVWNNPAGGTVTYTTTTDGSGNYYFCGLIDGTYTVAPVDPTDMTPSPADSGNDDFDDSDYPSEQVVVVVTNQPENEDGLTDVPGGTDNFPDNQEDISIDFAYVGIDYGDLPDGFNTTQANNGAAHLMQDGKYLGNCVDAELDGAPDFEAGTTGNGDDGTVSAFSKGTCNGDDDEDGIRFITPLVPGNTSCIEVTSTLPAGGGFLNGWIDYNGNDVFEANEQIVFNVDGVNGVLGAGTDVVTDLCFDVPVDAVFEGLETHLRFRLSCDGNLGPDGLAADGEVEDYYQPLAKLGDFVWEDVNGNGIQDAGEPGLGGLTVTLDVTDANGNPYQATTTTAANGMYMFFGLLPTIDVNSPYKLTFDSPGTDWVATGQDSPITYGVTPGDDTDDSDIDEVNFMVPGIVLNPKEDDPTIDAGFLVPAELGDFVWVDVKGLSIDLEDGLQQPDELPVEGAKVTLTGTDGLGRPVSTMLTTDANGNYLFEDLWPGDYFITVDLSMLTAPAELVPFAPFMVFTLQDSNPDNLDSDVNPGNYNSSTGSTPLYNLISQESELTVDAGLLIPCIPPSNLTSSMVMLTTATLTWQVNNNPLTGTNVELHCWNIEIGGAGFAVGNGQAIIAFTFVKTILGVRSTAIWYRRCDGPDTRYVL
jgi:hypothetical protein